MNIYKEKKRLIILMVCLLFALAFAQGCGHEETEKKDITFYYVEAEKAVLLEAYESAIAYYKEALELAIVENETEEDVMSPGILYFNIGYCYEQLNETDQALNYYAKTLDDSTSEELGLNALGHIYFKLENYELSKSYYEQAIALYPKAYEAYVNLSAIYALEADLPMALSLLTQAIELDSTKPDAYLNRAYIFAELGDEKLMKADIETLKQMKFSSLDVYIKIFNDTLKEGRS